MSCGVWDGEYLLVPRTLCGWRAALWGGAQARGQCYLKLHGFKDKYNNEVWRSIGMTSGGEYIVSQTSFSSGL